MVTVCHCSFGNHPLVTRSLIRVFECRPSLPHYKDTWDVSAILNHLKSWGSAEDLSLKDLTYKTVMLVVLLSGQRSQTVHALTVGGMKQSDNEIIFEVTKLLKTSKPRKDNHQITFKAFPSDKHVW